MYGVMVVVEDLDAFMQNPIPPADPIGSNRSFVKNWKVADLAGKLDEGLRGRSLEIGKRIFAEASCAGCHKIQGKGGVIGPELTGLYDRWKGDRVAILREILEPSHRIDDKYAMHLVLTFDGRTVSGILVEETKEQITLMSNPEEAEPTVIPQDDIEEVVKTSTSMMPKAILDQYTQDEIFEMLFYLENASQAAD
jgi:putative heme-binding domain-containing protein